MDNCHKIGIFVGIEFHCFPFVSYIYLGIVIYLLTRETRVSGYLQICIMQIDANSRTLIWSDIHKTTVFSEYTKDRLQFLSMR